MTALERRLWLPYDAIGVREDLSVLGRLVDVRDDLAASWTPPSPTYLELLRQVEADAEKALANLDHLSATDVAAFRRQAREAGAELLPE